MQAPADLEAHLLAAVAPPTRGLGEAIHYALFPAGARLRPQLCLALAEALGVVEVALPAAVALELVHNASLVHDDLPEFDDADTRRGKPSVQRAYGPAMALLVGDALLAHAFRVSAQIDHAAVRSTLAEAACTLIHGQAMELMPARDLRAYHAQKTACLFAAATAVPARLAGQAHEPYAALGSAIGHSYQLADDLFDASPVRPDDDKPRGRDSANARPNASLTLGRAEAEAAFVSSLHRVRSTCEALPCESPALHATIDALLTRFAALALPEAKPPCRVPRAGEMPWAASAPAL